jgi:predicted dehydrogenase
MATQAAEPGKVAHIAVVGAGWWSQGWHLPLLHAMSNVKLVGIVEPTFQPRSTLVEAMKNTEELAEKYGCPVYDSIDSLLAYYETINMCDGGTLDGIIIASPHSTHAEVAMKCFDFQKTVIKTFADTLFKTITDFQKSPTSLDPISLAKWLGVSIMCEKPMTTDVDEALMLVAASGMY